MIHMLAAWILLGVSHILCFWVLTVPKYSLRKTAAIYSLFFAAFICLAALSYLAFENSPAAYATAFTSTIVVALLVFILTSADSTCKKIFLFISYANVFCVFVCISLILCTVFLRGASEMVIYYARNIIRTVLFIPMALIYMRFLRPAVRAVSGQRRKTWYSISTVSILFLIIFAAFVVIFNAKYERVAQYIPLFAVVILIYISILWVIFGTIKSLIAESSTELIKQNTAYLQEELKTARENELLAKTIRHDFRHHIQNVESMLERGEVSEAMGYLRQYNDSLDAAKGNRFCPNVTVNAILDGFYTKAQGRGISAFIEADTGENTSISDMDFVAILSNLLENAINGCAECGSGGEIRVKIRTVADKTVIVCSNPCRQDIAIENNMIKNRGIGIASMLSAIRKYDGDIKYSVEEGVLTACILLNS